MATGPRTDILLSMSRTATENYMKQVVSREKTYEFRRRVYPASVVRIWFYETAPISAVTHICEVDAAHTHTPAQPNPIPEDGVGNAEYNDFHPDWIGYDHAYRIRSCRRIASPISLKDLRERYGLGCAPRGMVYVPDRLFTDVDWTAQEVVWADGKV